MKSMTSMTSVAALCAVGLFEVACSSGAHVSSDAESKPDQSVAELIGSIAASSKSLDGIGSLGLVYEYGGGYAGSAGLGGGAGVAPGPNAAGQTTGGASPGFGGSAGGGPTQSQYVVNCTGTLVSKNSVLTSRVCAENLTSAFSGGRPVFAIGAHSAQPQRFVDVVAAEFAPTVVEGERGSAPDLALVHLAESLTDVAPFPTQVLSDEYLGQALVAVGYGVSDLRYGGEARRAGAITLRARSGLLLPLIFNTFDAFYSYASGHGFGGGYVGISGGSAFAEGIAGGSFASAGAPGDGGFAGSGFAGAAGSGISGSAGVAGGAVDDWYRAYLLSQYNSTLLEPGSAYLGGTDDDTQPCYRDEGGPIARSVQGKVSVFGVFSRSPLGSCEKGALYATITPISKAFIDSAANWVDPCQDTSTNGKCVGTSAARCSSVSEGSRRLIKLDCALLNQVCAGGGTTEVTCSDP